MIKIPLLCPTLRAKFCGLRIFGCLVTGLLLFCFYLNFLGVLLSILSDGVGGVCEFSSTRKNSVLLVRSEAEDEDNLSRLSICRVSIPRRRIITNHFFHPPASLPKTYLRFPRHQGRHSLHLTAEQLGLFFFDPSLTAIHTGFPTNVGCFKPPKPPPDLGRVGSVSPLLDFLTFDD